MSVNAVNARHNILGAAAACSLWYHGADYAAKGYRPMTDWLSLGALWDPSELGYHRAVVDVQAPADWAVARLPWRRWDDHVADGLLIAEGPDGVRVPCRAQSGATAAEGVVGFGPCRAAGTYHVYFRPTVQEGVYYPTAHYTLADEPLAPERDGVAAAFIRFEAALPHHERTDMDHVATDAEEGALRQRFGAPPFIAFVEDLSHPIRHFHRLPARWVDREPGRCMALGAQPGQYLIFQIGVWASSGPVEGVAVSWAGDPPPGLGPIRCFNTRCVSQDGVASDLPVRADSGRLPALWCGVQVSSDAPAGPLKGVVALSSGGFGVELAVEVAVSGPPLADCGDSRPELLSRLRWLDSRIADDGSVPPPFTPLIIEGRDLAILGRTLSLGPDGLPTQVYTAFTAGVTSADGPPQPMFAASPIFTVVRSPLDLVRFEGEPCLPKRRTDAEADVAWSGSSGDLDLQVDAVIEFDGTLEYRLRLRARQAVELAAADFSFELQPWCSTHMMGLGVRGGLRPEALEWRWDRTRNQDALWIGAPNGGLQLTLKDEAYVRPLNTNFYQQQPLVLPRSWHNEGKGTVDVHTGPAGGTRVVCASGPFRMAAGEELRFDFRLAVTPFKPLDTTAHFAARYHHALRPVPEIAARGANVVNVHHATEINPYINYPFLRPEVMKAYIDEAHAADIRVKIYYTVRELTTRAPELWALRSLGDEVLTSGRGGGYAWLQEHLEPTYLSGWFAPNVEDCSLILGGMSRWQNHYLEGLDWLAHNVGIDGLYLDDVAFDRQTMKRIRRILSARRPDPIIDLHSANQYNERDGFASSANLYMEHLPYIDRLWFGEYFDYDAPPDQWLVEMSGIPFGLLGEMLEKGGNPWRGMLFGMTNRLGWSPDADPRPVWSLLDRFGMGGAAMRGWWSERPPVRTDHADVLCTAYLKPGRALLAVASWALEPVEVRLTLDREALGLGDEPIAWCATASEGFQEEARFSDGEPIRVAPGRGWLLEAELG